MEGQNKWINQTLPDEVENAHWSKFEGDVPERMKTHRGES